MASAAVHSEAVVLMFIGVAIVCGGLCLVLVLLCTTWCPLSCIFAIGGDGYLTSNVLFLW